jgi:hypothetical protein
MKKSTRIRVPVIKNNRIRGILRMLVGSHECKGIADNTLQAASRTRHRLQKDQRPLGSICKPDRRGTPKSHPLNDGGVPPL